MTRMKLQLAMEGQGANQGEGNASLTADVAEMEKMIDGYLAFARGEEGEETIVVSLQNLLKDVVADSRRRGADIELAAGIVGPAGVVLVAGKGHESYQEIAGERVPYSDADAVRRVLEG